MWWRERLRQIIFAGLAVAALVSLAACGFQPLYGSVAPGQTRTKDHLATVRIAPLPDRVGQQLHNLLRDRINPKGQPANPNYTLQIEVMESLRELGIRKDETATRASLTVFADFVLIDTRTSERVFNGRSRSFNSYNILESQFATLYSENDARDRALREISNDIRNRLAVYFARIADSNS
jgi:LPS-assembly lipoprotein